MSMRATPSGAPDVLARSISAARCVTSAPWLSVSVSGSRRVASMRATVCLVRRPCAERKIRNRSTAAMIAAVRVTATTSRRTRSSRSRTGSASRQMPTTARTSPLALIGRNSRSRVVDGSAPGPALDSAAGTIATLAWPDPALPAAPPASIATPPRPGSLAATIVPSSRRSSTRRISVGRVRAASWVSSAARSEVLGPDAGSRKRSSTESLRTARTVAELLATTVFRVFVEKCSETMIAWAVAVTPMIARNTPNTRMSSSGRRIRGWEPNNVLSTSTKSARVRSVGTGGPQPNG